MAMTRSSLEAFTLLFVLLTAGCASTPRAVAPSVAVPSRASVSRSANARFREALGALDRHDRDRSWTAEACRTTRRIFLEGAATEGDSAHYDAALVSARCG